MKRIKSKFFRRRKRNALSQVKRPGTGISPESQKGNYRLTWGQPKVPISHTTRLNSSFSLGASRVVASDLQQRTEGELDISLTILKCSDSETILKWDLPSCWSLSLSANLFYGKFISVWIQQTSTGKKGRKNSKCYSGMCCDVYLWT